MTGVRRSQRGFSPRLLSLIRQSKILGIRAGTEPHRTIGIWVVVVHARVFVRSWGLRPDGWYRTLLATRRGLMTVGGRQVKVRALHRRAEALTKAVSDAYAEKYNTRGSAIYVRGFRSLRRRNATIELVPLR